jgi:(+)-trans-carveol dehydrogenase
VDSVPYPLATLEDPAQTVKEVQALDRRIIATQADVRDYGAPKAALGYCAAQLGRLDIVSANAGRKRGTAMKTVPTVRVAETGDTAL